MSKSKGISLKATFDINSLSKWLKDAKSIVEDSSMSAIQSSIEDVYWRSQLYVPADSYALQESGKYTVTKTANGIEASVSYGDTEHVNEAGVATIEYARRVHDDLDMSHTKGRAKYLSTAFDEVMQEANVADTVLDKVVGGLT